MRPVRGADNLTTFICRLSWNLGASTSWNPQGLSRPLMGLLYLYLLPLLLELKHNRMSSIEVTLSSLEAFTLMTLIDVGWNVLSRALLFTCIHACVIPVSDGAYVFRNSLVYALISLLTLCSFLCPVILLLMNHFPGCYLCTLFSHVH